MHQSLIFQVDNKIVKEFCCYRIGEYVTIKFFRKAFDVFDYSIVDCGIMFRLAPGSLFKYFPDEVSEEYSFKWLLLTEVINIVLSRMAARDRL